MQRPTTTHLDGVLRQLDNDSQLRAGHFRERLTRAAWSGLGKTIPEVLGAAAVERGFCGALLHRLERTSYQVFATRGISWPSGRDELIDILKEFRGLSRIWDAQIRGWSRFVLLFGQHATVFQNAAKSQRGAILKLESDLSDLHNGRSVTRVCFRKGGEWYYKPRSGRREAAWCRFLLAINAAGFRPHFFVPEVYPGRRHCWMRGVPHRKTRRVAERRCLYSRIGVLLYVAHCFRAVDLHADNFVLHGEHPILIDCETLFHPETPLPVSAVVGENDLVRTGIIGGTRSHPLINGQLRAFCGPRLRKRLDDLTDGFRTMHRFLHHHAASHRFQRLIGRMRRERTRLILRPTILYSRLLDGALLPDYLRTKSGLAQELYMHLGASLCELRIVRREVQQLTRGDIPFFSGRPATGRPLLSSRQFDRVVAELVGILAPRIS